MKTIIKTKKHNLNLISGFTLVEILVSIAVLVLIVGGAFSIFVMSNQGWGIGSVQINIQQKARIALEKMIYGVAEAGVARNGIIGAEQIQILDYSSGAPVNPPSPGDRIDFQLSDAATRNRSFYLDNGRVWYQHNANFSPITPDPAVTGITVSNLQFISDVNAVLIGISLDMERMVGSVRSGGDTTIKVHLQSSFKKRN